MREAGGMCVALAIGAVALIAPAGAARAEVTELCRFDGSRLAEISGLAYSAQHEGIVWAHNDSGGGARLYALDIDSCEIRAVLRIRGIEAQDPEAIAMGTGPTGAPALWWGDVGDNTSQRRFIEIHAIPEPADLRSAAVDATTYRVRLEERQDSEAMLADGDQIWLIGKGLLGGTVWALPQPLPPNREVRARAIGTEEALVTDAAMRPGGGYAVRDYSEVRIYSGTPPGDLESRMPLPEQVQGEAMTWTPDGTSLIIASEGDDRLLLVPVGVPETSPTASPSPEPAATGGAAPKVSESPGGSAQPTLSGSPSSAPQDSPLPSPSAVADALEPVDRVGTLAVLALAIGAGVFIISAAAVAIAVRMRSR